MQKRKTLVTGGAGFIGSHLCEALISRGDEVFCLDNFSTGRMENVAHLTHRMDIITGDITSEVLGRFGPGLTDIYNLACPASPVAYQRDPIKTLRTCFEGTLNVLNLASRSGARVLQASTSEVYGDPTVHPQREDYNGNVNPLGPRACYDEGKRVAETLCMEYWKKHALPVRIARIFNTYGPRMQPDDGRVVSTFIRQALADEDITIYGRGNQTRSFCYVSDMVTGLKTRMNQAGARPINLGNPSEFNMNQLANEVLDLTDSRSHVVYRPLPEDDPKVRRPDITQAILMGWSPKVELTDGLKKTIRWFRLTHPKT